MINNYTTPITKDKLFLEITDLKNSLNNNESTSKIQMTNQFE